MYVRHSTPFRACGVHLTPDTTLDPSALTRHPPSLPLSLSLSLTWLTSLVIRSPRVISSGNALRQPSTLDQDQCREYIVRTLKDNFGAGTKLFCFAQAVLAMQASSAESERFFSSAGLLRQPHRNRLKPERVEQLLLVQQDFNCFVDERVPDGGEVVERCKGARTAVESVVCFCNPVNMWKECELGEGSD